MPIRAATIKDIDAMQRVRLAARENVLSDPASVTPEHYRQILGRDGRGWLFEESGEVVGLAIADHSRRSVWALFVHPDHEGRGIGRRLHDAMMRWMFATGAQTVWLGTEPGTRAERFYLAAGWTRAGLRENGELRFEMSKERYLQSIAGGSARGGST